MSNMNTCNVVRNCWMGILWKCSENHLLQKEQEKQKAEMDELAKKLLEAEGQLKKQATSTKSPALDKLKEQLAAAKQTNEKQEKEFQDVLEKKTHLQTEADEYANQIVFYGKSFRHGKRKDKNE